MGICIVYLPKLCMVVLLSYCSGIRDLLFTLNISVTICIHHGGIAKEETEMSSWNMWIWISWKEGGRGLYHATPVKVEWHCSCEGILLLYHSSTYSGVLFLFSRWKMRQIESNAKSRNLKKFTCKGTLRQVFICLSEPPGSHLSWNDCISSLLSLINACRKIPLQVSF